MGSPPASEPIEFFEIFLSLEAGVFVPWLMFSICWQTARLPNYGPAHVLLLANKLHTYVKGGVPMLFRQPSFVFQQPCFVASQQRPSTDKGV